MRETSVALMQISRNLTEESAEIWDWLNIAATISIVSLRTKDVQYIKDLNLLTSIFAVFEFE